jgi:hypothetical protein
MPLTPLDLPGVDVAVDPVWLSPDDASALFDALYAGIAWEKHRIRLFGGRWIRRA